jgi:chorismate mutase/prephenate dehydratase
VELNSIRERLDQVDASLVEALAERQRLVREAARLKAEGGTSLRDLPREEDILTRVVARSQDAGLDGFFMTRLFREILGQSLRTQEAALGSGPQAEGGAPLRVGYQGTEGAYSEMAARRHFGARGGEVSYRGHEGFEEMLAAVQDGDLDYAVLPLENTTSGSVTAAYDLLARMDLALVGEEILEVDHCLLALEAVPLTRIRRIYSHPVALSQCGRFLAGLQDCHVEAFMDTAMAARRIRDEQDLSQAAIASEEAARLYGLTVLKRGIQDQAQNFTRIVVVARQPLAYDRSIPCKTSLVFATRHEEGALVRCLTVLADHHLSMTKLESRPRPRNPWEYLFYVDFEGNLADPNVAAALREMAARTGFLKVFGSYPARTGNEAKRAEPRPRVALAPGTEAAPPAPAKEEAPAVLEKKPYTLASRAHRPEDTVIHVAGVPLGGPSPVVIAGPCAVETREQIRACARVVKELGGQMLRGGCFKPRTSPYSFQGLGYEALDLLAEAGAEVGLPIVTEVMHPADVGPVAEKAHVLQIGARNMQNFSLLKEVGKVDRPVMLKRGLMSSIDEWLSAAEYVLAHGNQMVFLCERGIRTFETSTRNTLDLGAVPVLKEWTHLPVIVDPSHAVGVRRWIPPMAEAALAAGAHGLMVEIHPDPGKALSDGPQALTFPMFEQLMQRLSARTAGAAGPAQEGRWNLDGRG